MALAAEPAPGLEPVHPNEPADKARLRSYRIDAGGRSLRLLRGEFHRHTEFTSHNDQDGLLEDTWRYALDAADLDWMGNGDHTNGFGHEYMWWLIQKQTDLHHHGRRFVAAHTYERSVGLSQRAPQRDDAPPRHPAAAPSACSRGPRRRARPTPRTSTPTSSTSAASARRTPAAPNMGTDWRDNDPEVEPVVEIYQGHRHNYEHFGAPRSPTEETQIGGYQPKGFVWNALEEGLPPGVPVARATT